MNTFSSEKTLTFSSKTSTRNIANRNHTRTGYEGDGRVTPHQRIDSSWLAYIHGPVPQGVRHASPEKEITRLNGASSGLITKFLRRRNLVGPLGFNAIQADESLRPQVKLHTRELSRLFAGGHLTEFRERGKVCRIHSAGLPTEKWKRYAATPRQNLGSGVRRLGA